MIGRKKQRRKMGEERKSEVQGGDILGGKMGKERENNRRKMGIEREKYRAEIHGGKIGKERENDSAEETDKENGRRKREVFCRDT